MYLEYFIWFIELVSKENVLFVFEFDKKLKIGKICFTAKLGAEINLYGTWGLEVESFWLCCSFVSLGNLHYVPHDSMRKDPLPQM